MGHAVKKVVKGIGRGVRSIVKGAGKAVKASVHLATGRPKDAWRDLKSSLGLAVNGLSGGYIESKARRTNEAYQKQMAEINALESASEMRSESNALANDRQANPYEADTTSLLEARDNPSNQQTLLTGVHGLDPSEMPLGRQSLLGGGM
jgi:hypothetical protein